MSLYHMWVIVVGPPEAIIFRGTHLLFAMALCFLLFRRVADKTEATPGLDAPPVAQGPPTLLDYALLAAAVAPVIYLFVNYDYFVNRIIYIDDLTYADMVDGRARSSSWCWRRRGASSAGRCRSPPSSSSSTGSSRDVETRSACSSSSIMTTEGIFGSPLGVSAAYVMLFVLFGSFMERSGTGQLFMDFALSHHRPHGRRARQGGGGRPRACSARSRAARSPT